MTSQITIGRSRRTSGGPNAVVLTMLRSPVRRILQNKVCALRFCGRRSGATITLPVEYTRAGQQIIVLASHGHTKSWWRNFGTPHGVEVWLNGRWRAGTGIVVPPDHPSRTEALSAYRSTHPRIPAETDDPLVTITLSLDAASPRRRSLWLSWFGAVTLGECLGFAAPATVGAATAHAASAISIPLLILAGALEGATLGWFQARVLRHALPSLSTTSWTLATASAAALAWAIGLTPSTIAPALANWPRELLIPLAATSALILLFSIGTAQWLILRTHVHRAGRWIWGTALAWAIGLAAFTAVTTPLWQPDQSTTAIALIGTLGGLVMASTVAAVTGVVLLHILGTARSSTLSGGGDPHARSGGEYSVVSSC